ncbi:MAG TPA: ATP-binding cassette domain-containing protein [Bacillota bacterium]|nr:ATP-binding cassette domain-containing protein [Bacillota bacterium]HPZ90884.1 ATP-binding cassette domain-containing protein [Bacillota bacterium]HQE02112.1 ATP-binding cassette domain-containing protein [Bacillota bacterium]
MQPVLEFNEVNKRFSAGGKAVQALDKVSFQVPPGTIFGLLGPNGAGKTTTVKAACGLVTPDSGSVTVGAATSCGNATPPWTRWRRCWRETATFTGASPPGKTWNSLPPSGGAGPGR